MTKEDLNHKKRDPRSTIDDEIYWLDANGNILSGSTGAESGNDPSALGMLGNRFGEFYSADEVKSGKPIRDLQRAEAQGRFDEEVGRVRKDGTEFRATVTTAAMRDGSHQLRGFVRIVRDFAQVSEDAKALVEAKVALEARVKERTQDLLRSNTELEQFAYIASHDLQTPLRHISSYVQLLTTKIRKTHGLDEKTERWVNYILTGTQQMKSLISDLLSYSRIGRIDMHVEEIDLAELLSQVREDLKQTIDATNAQLIYGQSPKIFGIKSQIEQLFQNLIENALKFKKANTAPIVTISCEEDGKFWRFSVSDNGIGIDSKYSDRIFKMFHRLHSADQIEGTGIGLAVCKKIVEFHGGKIGLNPDHSNGAAFFFTLPKKEKVTSLFLAKQTEGSP